MATICSQQVKAGQAQMMAFSDWTAAAATERFLSARILANEHLASTERLVVREIEKQDG